MGLGRLVFTHGAGLCHLAELHTSPQLKDQPSALSLPHCFMAILPVHAAVLALRCGVCKEVSASGLGWHS